jgi:uncharacterized protein YxeA
MEKIMKLNRLVRKGDAEGCVIIVFLILVFAGPFIFAGLARVYEDNKIATKMQERHQIEGVIQQVEPVPSDNKFYVKFTDGREKKLKGIASKPLVVGKYYRLTHDGVDNIIDVEEIK